MQAAAKKLLCYKIYLIDNSESEKNISDIRKKLPLIFDKVIALLYIYIKQLYIYNIWL